MRFVRKSLKIFLWIFILAITFLYWFFVTFSTPKSTLEILKDYNKSGVSPIVTQENFRGFEYRKLTIQKDTTLPILVFVHGAIGSIRDFEQYILDSAIRAKANIIAYDRVGYNYQDKNTVQESIAFERDMLLDIINPLKKEKVILVGYSYGGPIVLAVKEKVKEVILLAPAIYSSEETMPWLLNFYKWNLTKWLVPDIWKEASKEKISHKKDLQNFEVDWQNNPNSIVSVHGTKDWIVPFSNSKKLQEKYDEDRFKLLEIDGVGHGFVWTNYNEIKEQILKSLN
ncbi:pimeloyl-ACP methyl ester carboxylesterase [Tenacibaculum adriaticum]|uniref:Pimeloyl-ACP methyl ester carboxylesterase n=1 Tax=Tenacibaculum adriaticum TaxID=413713 RepID=A0A5S5DQX6_9FLAO|nr:pimeloyl-ACP methyl ester carboxylesterase [Tenacibaculum adriaticum]